MQFIIYPAASVIFFALTGFLPQVGLVAAIFSPLLLLLYFNEQKRNRYSDIFLGICVVSLSFLSPVLSGFYLLSALVPAVFILLHIKNGSEKSWMPAVISPLPVLVVMLIAIFTLTDYRNQMIEYTAQALLSVMDSIKAAKNPIIDEPYFQLVYKKPKEAALAVVMLFPAFNYIFTSFSAHISYSLFLKMKKQEIFTFRMPDQLVWALIGGFALIFIKDQTFRFIGLNLALVMMTLYSFQGFDIVNYWMLRLKIFPLIRALIFVFIFTEPPVIIVIALLGLFSVWFNLFGKQQNDKEQTPSN